GRAEVFRDYNLRVGQVTGDTHAQSGVLVEQRSDEIETGAGTALMVIDGARPPDWVRASSPQDVAAWLGLPSQGWGALAWDVFEAILTPGDVILVSTWRDQKTAEDPERRTAFGDGVRRRRVRVIRDYGMYDRREAPQYYPDAAGAPTLRS